MTTFAPAPVPETPDALAAQQAVERLVVRDAIAGALIGMFVCMAIWAGIVFLAVAGKDTDLLPMILVGLGVGALAGLFLGGSAGMVVGALKLEHHAHSTLPPATSRT